MALLRAIFRFDPSGWRPVGALLRLLGVALAVWIGVRAGGGWGAGVLASVGALYAGIASFGGVHGARLKRMVAATVAAALTTLLGCLVEPSVAWTVVATTVGTFALGLFAAAGPDAAQVALLATGTLIVFSGLPGGNLHPLGNAALVLGGGLGQAVILMAFHPISPVSAERRGVERVYEGLRRFAQAQSSGAAEPLPDVGVHAEARDLLRSSSGYGRPPELLKLWDELELADALRGGFAGLQRARAGAEVWERLAAWLEEAADGIARGRAVDRRLAEVAAAPEAEVWLRRIRRTIEAQETGRFPHSIPAPGSWFAVLRNVDILRTTALDHALRYAVAVGVAVLGYRLLNVGHGYWAPLSLAFSLRPDFASTITRGLSRTLGTAAGVLLATVSVDALHPSHAALTGAMLASAWAAFALQSASFLGYSAMLAFYVVTSVVLSGPAVSSVSLERLASTAAGAAMAFAAAVLWPRWEAGKARAALAVAFAAQAEYADAVTAGAPEAMAAARLRSRAARLEAERIVGAALYEPRWSRGQRLEGADAALARLAENAARVLAGHVATLDADDPTPPDDLRRLASEDRGMAADLMG